MVCYQIAESIVKVGKGKYNDAYRRKRLEYLSRPRSGASECPMGQVHMNGDKKAYPCVHFDKKLDREVSGHVHNAAMRYSVKQLLKDLWVEAHKNHE